MVIFYKKWKKYNEIQLTKNKMDLNIRKMTNHPPSPVNIVILCLHILAPPSGYSIASRGICRGYSIAST